MRILLIRFSSLGDVAIALSAAQALKNRFPDCRVEFLTSPTYSDLVASCPFVDEIETLKKGASVSEIKNKARSLNHKNFTHIFDQHSSFKSQLLLFFLTTNRTQILRKPKHRLKRWLWFWLRLHPGDLAREGQQVMSLRQLSKWDVHAMHWPKLGAPVLVGAKSDTLSKSKKTILAISPFASFSLKEWPMENWEDLIERHPQVEFQIFGSPDQESLAKPLLSYKNTVAKFQSSNLLEVIKSLSQADGFIGNDSGLTHCAEQLQLKSLVFLGPAPLGRPSNLFGKTTLLENENLACRPCSPHGQGPCTNHIEKQCLKSLSVDRASDWLRGLEELA